MDGKTAADHRGNGAAADHRGDRAVPERSGEKTTTPMGVENLDSQRLLESLVNDGCLCW